MTIYFEKHFGMTRGVSHNFEDLQQNDAEWQPLNKTEISQDYHALSGYERYLRCGFERIARIALGILCVIATLGFGLLNESVRRCFTGHQVLIVVIPKTEQLFPNDYFHLALLPFHQKHFYEDIKDSIPDLITPLPEWNSDANVVQWANSIIKAMKNHYPLQEERREAFVVDYEAAAYGYMRDKIDRAPIGDERKSILVCNLDQFMYQYAVMRKVDHQRARGLEATYELRLRALAQRFYDECRAQGLSNLNHREDIRQTLYKKDKQNGLVV